MLLGEKGSNTHQEIHTFLKVLLLVNINSLSGIFLMKPFLKIASSWSRLPWLINFLICPRYFSDLDGNQFNCNYLVVGPIQSEQNFFFRYCSHETLVENHFIVILFRFVHESLKFRNIFYRSKSKPIQLRVLFTYSVNFLLL